MVAENSKIKTTTTTAREWNNHTNVYVWHGIETHTLSTNRNQFKMVRVMALLLRSCGRLIIFTFPRNLYSLYAATDTYILMNTLSHSHTFINIYVCVCTVRCSVMCWKQKWHGRVWKHPNRIQHRMQSKNSIWIHWVPATKTHTHNVCAGE